MKTLFIVFLTLTLLQADELQRIESIINDIAKLRAQNQECKKALESKGILKVQTSTEYDCTSYEKTINILKEKNTLLDKKLQDKIQIVIKHQNKIKNYDLEVKTKDKEIETLKKRVAFLEKEAKKEPKIVIKKVLKEVVKEKKVYPKDDNVFPTLMPKKSTKTEQNKKEIEIAQETKPTTYRLKKESNIYSKPNGDKIYLWEKDRSFTSNQKTQNFIKITGYFIEKKWQKSKKELWIKKEDAFER